MGRAGELRVIICLDRTIRLKCVSRMVVLTVTDLEVYTVAFCLEISIESITSRPDYNLIAPPLC